MKLKGFSQTELYYGLNKETFSSQRDNIGKSNLRVLKNLSATIYFTEAAEALFLRLLMPEALIRIGASLAAAALSLLVFFLCKKALLSKKPLRHYSVNILVFFTSLFYYLLAAFTGTFFSLGSPAVKFILLLCVLQIIFIVPPFQNLLTIAVASSVFIGCGIYAKNSDLAAVDAFNVFLSAVVGAVMSWSVSKIKIENMISSEKLKKSNYDLYHETITDSLTGLANRKMTLNTLCELFADKDTAGDYLCCISIDIDCFREYNRFYGAPAGDMVLVLIGGAFGAYCEANNMRLGRVGGAEFMVLFKDASPDKCVGAARALQKEAEKLDIPNEVSAVSDKVTVSLGLFADKTEGYNLFEEVYTLSGRALYRAKEDGGNRVWRYIPEINGFSPVEKQ